MAEKTFPLEKILTISAKEYCEMKEVDLCEYDAVGVQMFSYRTPSESFHEYFAERVPKNAEVVVGYPLTCFLWHCLHLHSRRNSVNSKK